MLRKPTREAYLLCNALQKHGVDVHMEYDDGHKSVDLAIPSANLYIEVDGIHHLTDSKQIKSDLNRDYYSSENGVGTIHVHNWEVDENLDEIATAIADTATSRESDLVKVVDRRIRT